jgi:hypothetical protein
LAKYPRTDTEADVTERIGRGGDVAGTLYIDVPPLDLEPQAVTVALAFVHAETGESTPPPLSMGTGAKEKAESSWGM